ncbi:uncharacterized protein LOC110698145 [Chenopodium quinoa]|uniref:Uncharacterized protein n=1 Tax=Chenopodium quinoa TaxID=63459 RepID=A0A803MAR6_CHEQI|nr:uncharacterized protein LOC110698145 [Chenopodium quinoa]
MASSNHTRSTSYPPQSNPILRKVEDELTKLRKAEAESTSVTETICIGLTGLAKLYRCVDDVLSLPFLAHRTLSLLLAKHETPLIEGSSRLLEICGASKELLLKLLEAVRVFRCSNSEMNNVAEYFCLRKEIVKTSKGLALQLRQVEESLVSRNDEFNESGNFEVIRVLRCVSIINVSVLESLLRFLSMPLMSKSKSSSFGLISRLVVKKSKAVISEEKLAKNGNELSNVDVVLHALDGGENFDCDIIKKKLEVLEVSLRGIEDGLNNILKQLARTRASLMKIVCVC